MIKITFYYLFSILLCISSIITIVSENLINYLLWSMLTFLMIGGLFSLSGANYNAIIQVLIYVIAIPLLIAVYVMLTKQTNKYTKTNGYKTFFGIIGILLLAVFLCEFININNDIFEVIKSCSIYVNSFSDLISLSVILLEKYPVLVLEFGFGIIITTIGLINYEK